MKHLALTVGVALSMGAIAAPAEAALFKWDVEYTGFFAEGATIFGSFTADETAADDGVVYSDEFSSWMWSWSGNSDVDAFSISSDMGFIDAAFGPVGFFVDGMTNAVGLADGLEQGVYTSNDGTKVLDLEFLLVQSFDETFASEAFAEGDLEAPDGAVTVADATPVPEPATVVSLLAAVGLAGLTRRQQSA